MTEREAGSAPGDPPDDILGEGTPDREASDAGSTRGRGILRGSIGGTVVFTAAAVGAVLGDGLLAPFVILSLSMFLVGSVVFVVAFLRAVGRSRDEAIGIGGLFFGAGTTPGRVQAALMGSLAVEVIVALGAAAIRPYTAVAFGTLAPMWGLGLAGLWVSSYGVFPERVPEATRSALRDADRAAHRRVGGSPSSAGGSVEGSPAAGPGAEGAGASGADGVSE